jgi:very-short-patch-repair endonuclease
LNFLPQRSSCNREFKGNACRLRRDQTEEEKQLWRALRGRKFAGFKLRRQHTRGDYILDFYCVEAKLAIELDGFQHGLPKETQKDDTRTRKLAEKNIDILRFWNHQWRENRDGCLVEIWNALQQRTGIVQVMNRAEEQTFIPPDLKSIKPKENLKHFP